MADPVDATPFEVIKVAMSQTKDGVKLVLAIHPHDNADDVAELFSHPVGTRYMVALVKVEEDGQPTPRPIPRPARVPKDHYVADAGMLCRNDRFQDWLYDHGHSLMITEKDAVDALHRLCGIESRSELATNKKAREIFDRIRLCASQNKPLK